MKKIFLFLLVVFFLFLPVVSANNDTYYVGNNATVDGQGTIDDPYNNLNLALGNVGDNDTILINDGIYTGVNNTNLVISKNNLLIKANGDVTFTGSCIFINNGNDVTLAGLKFVNCTENVIWNNKVINLYNLSFYNNVAEDAPCVESVRGATLSVNSCIFVKNNSTLLDAGGVSNRGNGTITDCIFIGNHAYRDGGAVRNHGGILTICNSLFINNTAYGNIDYSEGSYGGAIYQWIGTIYISDCIFTNNYAKDYGGAIYICKGRMVTAYSNLTICNNIIINNSAKHGGAIFLEGCKGDVFCNVFVNNTKDTIFLGSDFLADFNSTINDNWWGENSPDWASMVKNMNSPSTYVTLNLTVGSTILKTNETTDYSYDFYIGDVKADIPQRNVTITSSGGNLTDATFSSSDEGKYTLTARADNEVNNVEIIVSDNPAILRVDDVDKYFGGEERLIVNLTDSKFNPIANATVTININGKEYNRSTDDNGIASMAINLNGGTYDVKTTYDIYSVESSITVRNTLNGSDVVKVYKNETQYWATFLDSHGNFLASGTNVTFNINGVFYNRTVGENGLARLNINLAQGNYILTAMNPVTGENAANNITVLAKITDNNDLVKYYRNDSQYYVKVIGDDGNPVGANESVTFNINGVFYKRLTDENGVAKLNINLRPGDYIITCEYEGCRVSNNITVLDVLNASDLVKAYGSADQFHVQLVDGVGNPFSGQNITFNINGVFYTRLTNASGIASLNINLLPGEYIISSIYDGYAISNTVKVEEI